MNWKKRLQEKVELHLSKTTINNCFGGKIELNKPYFLQMEIIGPKLPERSFFLNPLRYIFEIAPSKNKALVQPKTSLNNEAKSWKLTTEPLAVIANTISYSWSYDSMQDGAFR